MVFNPRQIFITNFMKITKLQPNDQKRGYAAIMPSVIQSHHNPPKSLTYEINPPSKATQIKPKIHSFIYLHVMSKLALAPAPVAVKVYVPGTVV